MAAYNQISLTQIKEFNRMDSEFYKEDYMKFTQIIMSHSGTRLSCLANITDGIHDSPQVVTSGIQYISAKCVKDNEFIIDNCIQISHLQNSKNPRTQLSEGDVIITSVGTIGNVAVVESDLLPSNCDRHVGIIRIKKNVNLSPYYLSTFLNSKYGRFQSLREAAGNVQLNLYVRNIGFLIIPRLGDFEKEIADKTFEAYRLRDKSKILYNQAQELLEKGLGLDKFIVNKLKSYETRFSEVTRNNRVDAEFFNPKYINLNEYLVKYGAMPLGSLFSIARGKCADTANYSQVDGVPFIRIKELSFNRSLNKKDCINIPRNLINPSFTRLNYGDYVLAVIGATIGKVNLIESEFEGAVFSNNTARLRPKNLVRFPHALELVMRSDVIQDQIKQRMAKTAQEKIADPELVKILIPSIPDNIMAKLDSLIIEAKKSMLQSEKLLEGAKKMVEDFIEGVIVG